MKKIIAQKDKIFFFGSLAMLLAALGAVIYYICGPSAGYFHADCTDSLYWANASIESGQLIADNFRYAALLPFSANLYMMPLIKLFGMTMKTQMLSMLIFALLYTASQIYVLRSMKLSYSFSFAGGAFMLMLLSSSVKMREIMWEHTIYYSLALLFFNLILAFTLRFSTALEEHLDKGSKRTSAIIYAVLLALACFFSSANGLPLIFMTTLPIFAGLVLKLLFNKENKLFSKKNFPLLLSAGGMGLLSALGFLAHKLITHGVHADYTNVYSVFSSADKWADNLLIFPSHFISLLGFKDDSVYFISLEGIVNLLAIALFVILLLTPLVALCFYRKLKHESTKALLLSYISMLLLTMLLFVFGNTSNASWRIIPLIGIAALSTLSAIGEILYSRKEAKDKSEEEQKALRLPIRGAVAIILMLSMFSVSAFVGVASIPADYGRDNDLYLLTQAIEEEGLTYGYATFWNSQAITMLSNSKIKCREILVTYNEGAQTDYYQSSYDWYLPQEGVEKYFLLLSNREHSTFLKSESYENWYEQLTETIHPLDSYVILIFDGYLEGIAP